MRDHALTEKHHRTTQPNPPPHNTTHLHRHIARITLVAVGAVQSESNAHRPIILKGPAFPHPLVEALGAAVEVVGAVVGRQGVFL